MSSNDRSGAFLIGLLIVGLAMGSIFGAAAGWLTVGVIIIFTVILYWRSLRLVARMPAFQAVEDGSEPSGSTICASHT